MNTLIMIILFVLLSKVIKFKGVRKTPRVRQYRSSGFKTRSGSRSKLS